MKELMEQMIAFWNNYWGESLIAWFLLAAVIWLLLFRRKKETTKYMLLYLAVSLFIFFCPFTAKIIQACIGTTVYWRVLWLVPSSPVIAYAMTEFLRERKKLWKPLALAALRGFDRARRERDLSGGKLPAGAQLSEGSGKKLRESASW